MIANTARVDGAILAQGVHVWDYACIREGSRLGVDCVVGAGAYIGPNVTVGAKSKIQNAALVYDPAVIGAGVFVGPGAILTNDRHPRAVNSDFSQKKATDWTPGGVTVLDGASIGAQAVCVGPITIGRWAMVAAGSVVTRDIPDFALVAGNPARKLGWVGRSGERLVQLDDGSGCWACPRSNETYVESPEGYLMLKEDLHA